jgi:hypothetical protein
MSLRVALLDCTLLPQHAIMRLAAVAFLQPIFGVEMSQSCCLDVELTAVVTTPFYPALVLLP